MQSLLAGYQRFRAKDWPEKQALFQNLSANGQQPDMLVIACVDSRVDPSMIFDTAPGEMLVVRNVANLVPPYAPDAAYHGTSAALEFGIKVLNIPDIVVLGHGQCGGVRALLDGAPDHARDFVAPWMSMAKNARATAMTCTRPEERQSCCEQEVIKTSLANLMTYPWIKERVAQNTLRLHGAWFAIHDGSLKLLNKDGSFTKAG